MTQSRASANAASARRRSSSDSEAWERNVVTPRSRRRGAELLDQRPAVTEHQPLLAPVQRGDDRRRVVHGADVVELDVGGRRDAGRPTGATTAGRTPGPATLQPGQQLRRGCRRSRTARSAAAGARQSRVSRSSTASRCQPRSSPAKACDLVDDHGPQVGEELPVLDLGADQHRLERLRRGQQDVGRLAQDPPAARTQRRRRARPRPLGRATRRSVSRRGSEVVEQRLQRADVEHRQPGPALVGHRGQQREHRPPRSCRRRSGRAAARRARPAPARRPPAAAAAASAQPRVLTMWWASAGCSRSSGVGHGRSSSMSSARTGGRRRCARRRSARLRPAVSA